MSAGSSPLYPQDRRTSVATGRGLVLIAALLVLLALGVAVLAAIGPSLPVENELMGPFRWPAARGLA